MIKFCFFFLLIFSISCSQKINIPQNKVVEKLTRYGKRNPENLILITTAFGEIKIKLYEETPLHRADFIRLIKNNVFNEKKIYRIVEGLCIQGGLFPDSLNYEIPSEILPNLKHKVGSLSMAAWNSKLSSPTEFFIVSKISEKYAESIKKPKEFLNNEFTIFGEVIGGQEVVEKIATEKLKNNDEPVNTILFSSTLTD